MRLEKIAPKLHAIQVGHLYKIVVGGTEFLLYTNEPMPVKELARVSRMLVVLLPQKKREATVRHFWEGGKFSDALDSLKNALSQ